MTRLIDFHTHFFSRTFFETLAAASPLPGTTAERMREVTARAGLELPDSSPEEHADRWLSELDRHGVEHAVAFASLPEEAPDVLRAVAHARGRLSAFCVVDPTRPGAVETLAERFRPGAFRGALFFPALHGYDLDGPAFAAALDALEPQGTLVVVHCGMLRIALRDGFGLPRTYDVRRADPLRLIPAADAHPNLRFVIPHFGAGLFRETLMAGAQCANVCVDTSSSNDWRATQPEDLTLADVFERTLGVFGTGRILFGTDSSVFPRGWRRPVLLAQREALGACGLGQDDMDAILGGNAATLLGLRPAEARRGEGAPGQFSTG